MKGRVPSLRGQRGRAEAESSSPKGSVGKTAPESAPRPAQGAAQGEGAGVRPIQRNQDADSR